jgi:N-formylglutamate deformylase
MANFERLAAAPRPTNPFLVHIPHGATAIPERWRSQLVLDDAALERELLAMTDRHTEALFAPATLDLGGVAFVNRLSRLVMDPERFEDDSREPMSEKGMGCVYVSTSDGRALRPVDYPPAERQAVIRELFRPYTSALEAQVGEMLERFGRCLIVDGHSFPARALPYEDAALDRPDLCLGYDEEHASESLISALRQIANAAGWSVGRNTPFAGSYVPARYWKADPRVSSLMLEVNRGRYMDRETGERSGTFAETRALVGGLLRTAVLFEAFRYTDYRALTSIGELCIRVGEKCPELDALLSTHALEEWAYITAYNPHGRELGEDVNADADRSLKAELVARGMFYCSGASHGDLGDWPPEPSVLILGLSESDAIDLGVRYAQAAIVSGKVGERARLIPLLDSPTPASSSTCRA